MEEIIIDIHMSDNYETIISQAMDLYGQALLELVYSYTQNRDLAEDLTQEIFIKCYQKLHQYNGKAKLES
ncbi:hypothetical protein MUG87_16415 [Ectobacillus sp. JY-23]|uniref:sigma factor n=1 Tax=Ectobacillus sp. JY-23 TaxID=2933872 RepID=UPI001FF653C6|nr:sigma factor [Ectobacillus sp. JY-23]UOY92006.1 hypothetical protein MUG87_16415 [Ectobacillus sp. JY-23]